MPVYVWVTCPERGNIIHKEIYKKISAVSAGVKETQWE